MRYPEWDEYVSRVLRHVRFFPDRRAIREELEGHLEDAFEALTGSGTGEKEAVAGAVAEMGDAAALGRELNEVHSPLAGWIWAVSKLLLGLLLIVSLLDGVLLYLPVAVSRSLFEGYRDAEYLGEPLAVVEVDQSAGLGNRTIALNELRIYGDGTVEVRYRTLYSIFSRAQKVSWYPTYLRDDTGGVCGLTYMYGSDWLISRKQFRTESGTGIDPDARRLFIGSGAAGQELEFEVYIGDWGAEA